MKTVDLFGEEGGMTVFLDKNGDIVDSKDDAAIRVVGHSLYCCTLDEARNRIASQARERMNSHVSD